MNELKMTPFFKYDGVTIYNGHVLDILKGMESESIQCCVTSPPYWGLRNYGLPSVIWDDPGNCDHDFSPTLEPNGNGTGKSFRRDKKASRKRGGHQPGFCTKCNAWCGSLGLEPNPYLYVQHIAEIFREIRRTLKKDGTLWLNMGDTYATGAGKVGECPGGGPIGEKFKSHFGIATPGSVPAMKGLTQPNRMPIKGLKPKDLCMIPARVALALQEAGWWLRSDIVWNKPNHMPESVKDRPTRAHEYLFLLTKSRRYYYDADAIKEPASPESHARYARGRSDHHKWADGGPGNQTIAKTLEHMRKPGVNPKAMRMSVGWEQEPGSHDKIPKGRYRSKQNPSFSAAVKDLVEYRNKRTVWTIPTQPFPGYHFATFPEKLVEPCILAGSRIGDIVLDPFSGRGTTALVSKRLHRKCMCIDLSTEYCEMAANKLTQTKLPYQSFL